jgi:hypothetical protein
MTPRRVLAVLVLGLFGVEAWALTTPERGDTISEVIWELADKWHVITLGFGVLMGHFFWPRQKPLPMIATLLGQVPEPLPSPYMSPAMLERVRKELDAKASALIPPDAKGAAIMVLNARGAEIGGAMKYGSHFVIEGALVQRWAKEKPTAQVVVKAVWTLFLTLHAASLA